MALLETHGDTLQKSTLCVQPAATQLVSS
uniref:Uncharacterized protein n=1 Tax=Anguilla anguilla TaxID=7936 RepID=A0A0E9U2J5_ANGAN